MAGGVRKRKRPVRQAIAAVKTLRFTLKTTLKLTLAEIKKIAAIAKFVAYFYLDCYPAASTCTACYVCCKSVSL